MARTFPVMHGYIKPRYGTLSFKGHVVTLPHKVQNVSVILRQLVTDLPLVTFCAKGRDERNYDFKVRRKKY